MQAETIKNIKKVSSNDSMGETQSKEWYHCLKHGQKSVESNKNSMRPWTSRNPQKLEKVNNLVVENHQIMTREIKNEVCIAYSSVQVILIYDLNMHTIVPKLLTCEQQEVHLEVARDILECVNQSSRLMMIHGTMGPTATKYIRVSKANAKVYTKVCS